MNKRNIIETLQMDVEIPDVVQKKANQAFAIIRENNIEVNANDNVIPYSNKQSKTISKYSKKKIAVIAVAATLALATLSAAAAYWGWSKSLSEGFQATETQKTQMEESNMSTFVNQSCSDQGITVTAVQSITDNYYTHIVLKVEGYELEEGIQPDFETLKVTIDGKEDFKYTGHFYDGLIMGADGSAVYADGSPIDTTENLGRYVMEDGSLEYWITLSSHEKRYFINKPVHVELDNIGTVSKAEYHNELNGTWSFDWDLQGSEDMKECTLNAPLGDTDATVVKAEITPISLRAEYEFPRQEVTETAFNENGEEESYTTWAEPPELTGIKMKDGTIYPFISLGADTMGYVSEDSDIYTRTFPIDRIIDVDQVESLLFIKSYAEEGETISEDNFYVVPLE
ncbi:MAG: DUF4179 domain-containing protein [Lachnospiraceae bacterium]